MHRLDPETHAALPGVGDELGDAVGNHATRGGDIPVGRRAAHEHEHAGPELRRLVDGAAILLDPRRALFSGGRGEHPPAAHARDAHSRIPQQAGRCLHADLGELVTPYRDVRHAVPGTGLHDLLERRPLGGDLIEAEAADPRGRRLPSPHSGEGIKG